MSRRPGPPAAHRRRRAASLGFVFYIAASSAAIYPLSLHDALPISYERRFLFVGTDEYQRVLRAGMFLTAAVAVASYAFEVRLARGYVVVALPLATATGLALRFALRKRLHRSRLRGEHLRRALVGGH